MPAAPLPIEGLKDSVVERGTGSLRWDDHIDSSLPALSNADDSVLTADTDFIQGIHEQAGELTVYEDMSP